MELQKTKQLQSNEKTYLQVSLNDFKVPPVPLPAKPKKVLTEDDFTQGISKIIERDFFPDLRKLETQKEYYEAIEKNDLVKLQEIQMRLKRPNTTHSEDTNTPATFETPEEQKNTPASKVPSSAAKSGGTRKNPLEVTDDFDSLEEEDASAPKVKLDSFLSKNTSEDSASFVELLEESERKRRMKHAWLFSKEKEFLAEHKDMQALPSIDEQAQIKDKPTHLNTWKYINENAVMYVPHGEELSAKELIELKKHNPKKIVHENTRFHIVPFNNNRSKEAMVKAASFKALINHGKIGHDGKEIQPGQSPEVDGYGFVKTPSPAPGVTDSPMMTWGEIDSTPARLDSNDMPTARPGPIFRIPAVPRRDRLALELSEKASKAHRAKKEEAIRQVTRRFASPSPSSKISISSAERISSMSPAAQRLASKKLGIKTTMDKALQDSYSPSPSHRSPGTKTPVRMTPGSKRSRSSLLGSPAISTPGSERAGNSTPSSSDTSLTDHLLQLPERKRKKASDFF